ncbi:hypothetical protein [Streptomyces sp. NPDC051636]|uniref:hypothetical protein n=1 Tax=Streptomyces sp. NPDC051636 TaxID=3365663 RepID=UPI00378F546A
MDYSHAIERDGVFLALPSPIQLKVDSFKQDKPNILDWTRDHGGAEAPDSLIKLVLEGRRKDPVKVIEMEAVKQQCRAPLQGTAIVGYTAGGEENVGLLFDLDSPRPVAKEPPAVAMETEKIDSSKLGNYFDNHSVALDYGEKQTFTIKAYSLKSFCDFVIEITVIDGNSTAMQKADDAGQTFRVTARRPYREYAALYVGGAKTAQCDLPGAGWLRQDPSTYNDLTEIHC